MSTITTTPDVVPMCEACHRRPVRTPGATYQERPTKSARYCYECLECCGDSEDVYHRCPICQPHPEPVQPDTSIRDNECQCSLMERCALCRRAGATTSAYNDGINPACGDPQKSTCDGCGSCTICVGCHCDED